jgi:hypothetical protein
MRSNWLQFNANKTEVLWMASTRRQYQLLPEPLIVDGQMVAPVRLDRNLGVFIDSNLIMRTHVAEVVSRCFAMLCHLRQVQRSLPATTVQRLVVALILNWIDCANSTLAGLPTYLVWYLQSALNASARLIYTCLVNMPTSLMFSFRCTGWRSSNVWSSN